MPSDTNEKRRTDPWDIWTPGIDRAFDALERISVLIRENEDWDDAYAYKLGASARRYASQCPRGFRLGLEMVLSEHGNLAAIQGWLSEAPDKDISIPNDSLDRE